LKRATTKQNKINTSNNLTILVDIRKIFKVNNFNILLHGVYIHSPVKKAVH